jgi:hypothetical protein
VRAVIKQTDCGGALVPYAVKPWEVGGVACRHVQCTRCDGVSVVSESIRSCPLPRRATR